MLKRALLGGVLVSVILILGFFLLRWMRASEVGRLESGVRKLETGSKPGSVSFRSLENLPKPVRKYFRRVLKDGRPFIRAARITQSGELTISPEARAPSPFTAKHTVSIEKTAFVWVADIELVSFLGVRVVDSYVGGIGAGSVALLSAIPMGSEKNRPRLNSAALYRYLAEAVWYPTALLPENGVRWTAIDDHRARAAFTNSGMTVSVEFTFNDVGEIVKMYTEERYGLFDGKFIRYPWEGRYEQYIEQGGMMIPKYGRVGWHLPAGFWLFWKGEIKTAHYE